MGDRVWDRLMNELIERNISFFNSFTITITAIIILHLLSISENVRQRLKGLTYNSRKGWRNFLFVLPKIIKKKWAENLVTEFGIFRFWFIIMSPIYTWDAEVSIKRANFRNKIHFDTKLKWNSVDHAILFYCELIYVFA